VSSRRANPNANEQKAVSHFKQRTSFILINFARIIFMMLIVVSCWQVDASQAVLQSRTAAGLLVTLALALASTFLNPSPTSRRMQLFSGCGFIWIAVACLQTVPLPPVGIEAIAPETASVRRHFTDSQLADVTR